MKTVNKIKVKNMINSKFLEESLEESSGNIFADLDIPNPDEYLTKAKLASHLSQLIQQRNLTTNEATKLLALNECQFDNLITGKLDDFSLEHLFQLLNALDQDIEIIVHPKKSPENQASIKVIFA